jgi:hypothetical protein
MSTSQKPVMVDGVGNFHLSNDYFSPFFFIPGEFSDYNSSELMADGVEKRSD